MNLENNSRRLELEKRIRECRANLCEPSSVMWEQEWVDACTWQLRPAYSNVEDHSELLKKLADALMFAYYLANTVATLEEAIGIHETLLRLHPSGHGRHAQSLHDLGSSLKNLCMNHRADSTVADRCVQVLEAALQLRPSGHLQRDESLYELAHALHFLKFEDDGGDPDLLAQVICLNREALELRPTGHHGRVYSLNNLACALRRSFESFGDPRMLTEAIELHREVLQLHPPWRHYTLNNLSGALLVRFQQQGGLETLAEVISMRREVVQLRTEDVRLRGKALESLGDALVLSHSHQGNSGSLAEAISLHREALQLALRPESQARHGNAMCSLAASLLVSYREYEDAAMIVEAVDLLRQALIARPPGHRLRPSALYHLAEALEALHNSRHDAERLTEAITLHREALLARPSGHPQRAESLMSLARLICTTATQSRDSWMEAQTLYDEALAICSLGSPTRSRVLCEAGRCFLDPCSPFFNLSRGCTYLAAGYGDDFCHVNERLRSALSDLGHLENIGRSAEVPGASNEVLGANIQRAREPARCQILDLYAQVVGLLPRAANFGLTHESRFRAVAGLDEIARNAAARAIMQGHVAQSVELLEQGRCVFWSQTLCIRANGFDSVPENDREELERLLQLLEHGTRRLEGIYSAKMQRERDLESQRQLNEAVEIVISRIRTYPGLGRFLMPASFDTLFGTLPNGFVVVVNTSKLGQHALLLNRAAGLADTLELKTTHAGFDLANLRTRMPRDMSPVMQEERHGRPNFRAMRLDSGQAGTFEQVLTLLWTNVAYPVVHKLRLKVSAFPLWCSDCRLNPRADGQWSRSATSLVVYDW
jgi:tetratricopeptide (TPR) repeat protein